MDKLNDLLNERNSDTNISINSNTGVEREIYEEEQKQIDEWGNEVKKQVKQLFIFLGRNC